MVKIIGIAFAYFVIGLFSLQLAIPPGYAAPVWPAAGVALAVILLYGNRVWPGIFLGSFFVNIFTSFDPATVNTIFSSLFVPVSIAAGAVIQALFSAFLIHRFAGFPTTLDNLSNVFRIMALGGPVGCLINASVGVTILLLSDILSLDNFIQSWWTWYLGDFIGVIIIIPLVVVSSLELRYVQMRAKLAVAIPVCLAIFLTIFLFFEVRDGEKGRIELLFGRHTDPLIQALNSDFNAYIEVLYSIEGLFSASQEVEREEFHQFVPHLLARHPGIQALEWIPRVSADQQHIYEEQARKDGYPDFQIREKDAQGQMVPASKRDEYFPVYFVEPFSGNEKAFGFDLASNPARLEALYRARDSGKPIASSRIVLVQESSQQNGVLLFLPVYKKGLKLETVEERRQSLTGFVIGVFRVGDTINQALLPYDLNNISFQFFDLSAKEGPQLLYTFNRFARLASDLQNEGEEDVNVYDIGRDEVFEMAGRQWKLSFFPTPDFFEEHKYWGAMTVLFSGFLFSSLLGAFLLMVTGRTAMTERLVSERTEALKFSEEKHKAIVNNAVDGIITINEHVVVQSFNPAAERIFGYRAKEVVGKNVNMLQPEPYHSEHDQYVKNYLRSGKKKIIGIGREVVGLRKDGTTFPLDLAVSEVRLDNKRLFTGIIRDITDRKQVELELKEAMVAAGAASKAKSDFLASMSHEIRTPMNAIIGMADLLAETEMDMEQKEYVQIFKSAGENLLTLINDILDISKIEAGHLELERIDFNLRDVIEKTCEIMALRAHKKGIELTFHIMPDLSVNLIGDPLRLQQVFINLVGNAIKFTEQGEINIEVKEARKPEKDKSLEILCSVADTGIGIPRDKIGGVFEQFTQVDSSTTRQYGGTGLGLNISQQIVALMGGKIWVESELGIGSTFYFTAQFNIAEKPIERASVIPVELVGLRALVVDDNATNRLVLKEILSKWGIQITERQDGESGLVEINRAVEEAAPYDLILLDCRMPEMDGFEVARHIKSNSILPKMTVLMLTSDNRAGDISKAKDMGISSYLVKPVKQEELKNAILHALHTSRNIPEEIITEKEAVKTDIRPLHILLVEDSEDNRLLIQTYLKKTVHSLDTAENGAIAVEKFKHGKYDLVLMDMQMPVMDGYSATREIRLYERDQGLKEIPIIALTAYALKGDEKKSLDAGCTAHLTKPIKKAKLLEFLSQYADG